LHEVVVVASYSYADVVERLFAEFGDRLTLPAIVEVVRECHEQLSSVPASALPELLERLARQRLTCTATVVAAEVAVGKQGAAR
jgi:hypothetical protein